MENYCKNCGAKLTEDDDFCPDCGRRINTDTITCSNCGKKLHKDVKFCSYCGHPTDDANNFCPDCGTAVEANQDFCSECGGDLNGPAKTEESFLDKHRDKLLIGGVSAVLVLILLAASMWVMAPVDVGTQTVEVGSTDFIIPGDFEIEPSTIDVDYQYSGALFAKGWLNDEGEVIYIATMTVPYGIDTQDVLSSQGGTYENIMDHDGYYTEDDGTYNFAFEEGDNLCIVSVSDPYLLDEITCLG